MTKWSRNENSEKIYFALYKNMPVRNGILNKYKLDEVPNYYMQLTSLYITTMYIQY